MIRNAIVNLTDTQCGFSNILSLLHDFCATKSIVGNGQSSLELPNFIPIPVKLTMPVRFIGLICAGRGRAAFIRGNFENVPVRVGSVERVVALGAI
jgi:hypothetical protein